MAGLKLVPAISYSYAVVVAGVATVFRINSPHI